MAGGQGQGAVTAFLALRNAAGEAVQVASAVAELVRQDGTVEASAAMKWDDGEDRYRASLGMPPPGTYALRALLVVTGFDIRLAGPAVVRSGDRGRSGVP